MFRLTNHPRLNTLSSIALAASRSRGYSWRERPKGQELVNLRAERKRQRQARTLARKLAK